MCRILIPLNYRRKSYFGDNLWYNDISSILTTLTVFIGVDDKAWWTLTRFLSVIQSFVKLSVWKQNWLIDHALHDILLSITSSDSSCSSRSIGQRYSCSKVWSAALIYHQSCLLTPIKERFLSLVACTSHRQVSDDNDRIFSYPSQKYRVKAIFLDGTLAITDERLDETQETSTLFDLGSNVLNIFSRKFMQDRRQTFEYPSYA